MKYIFLMILTFITDCDFVDKSMFQNISMRLCLYIMPWKDAIDMTITFDLIVNGIV